MFWLKQFKQSDKTLYEQGKTLYEQDKTLYEQDKTLYELHLTKILKTRFFDHHPVTFK